MKVYVFKGKSQGKVKVYGFTEDATGANLPDERGPWSPSNELDMNRGEQPRIAVDTDEALDNIEKHGFHIQGAKITFEENPSA